MSARDDAPTVRAPRAPWGRRLFATLAVVTLFGALPGAALLGLLAERYAPDRLPRYEARIPWSGHAPSPAEWPRAPRAGESAERVGPRHAPELAVRSFTWEETEALARAIRQRRVAGISRFERRRAEARAAWARGVPIGPPMPLSPAGEALSLVYGRASVARALAAAVSSTTSMRAGVPTPIEFDALLHREAECDRLALAGAAGLPRAFADAAAAERAWLAALARALPPTETVRTLGPWRAHTLQRAAALEQLAVAIEEQVPPLERAQAGLAVRERSLMLEPGTPDPSPAILAAAAPLLGAPAQAMLPTWIALFTAGAAGGILLVLPLAAWLAPRMVREPPRRAKRKWAPRLAARLAAGGTSRSRLEGDDVAWLHVVSGPDSASIHGALLDLAARLHSRGGRVLIVDGGRRLRLHERFGGDARWGLIECLTGEMPLLGTVQSVGTPGLYLLARGNPTRDERWALLGRLLEEARPHFGHVLLALDFAIPHAVGDAVAGRRFEAWWSEPGTRLPRAAAAFGERLGNAVRPMELWTDEETALERLAGPIPIAESHPLPGPEASLPPEPSGGAEAGSEEPGEPAVLDCDLQVRERLRFLIWMRRVQAESRRADGKALLIR